MSSKQRNNVMLAETVLRPQQAVKYSVKNPTTEHANTVMMNSLFKPIAIK